MDYARLCGFAGTTSQAHVNCMYLHNLSGPRIMQPREFDDYVNRAGAILMLVFAGIFKVLLLILKIVALALGGASSEGSRRRDLSEDDGYSAGPFTDGLGNTYRRDPNDSKLKDWIGKSPK